VGRISAVLDEELIRELDRLAREERTSRSELLRRAALAFIDEHRRRQEEKHRRERLQQAVEFQDRLRAKSGSWDGVAEVRRWRERAQ
jgi:metal-responsive CopG/Arc/MetJ family transcriptional regulator